MKVKVRKLLALIFTIIFALSAANVVHAVGAITGIISVGSEPEGLAYDSAKGEIFVADGDSSSVSVISDSNNSVVATIKLATSPCAIVYDSGKGEIFAANYENAGFVYEISDTNNSVVATVPVGSSPTAIAYDSGKGEIFTANFGNSTVSVISDSTNTVVATIPVGYDPSGITYDPATGEICVTDLVLPNLTTDVPNSVSIISDSNNTVVANVYSGYGDGDLVYDSEKGEIFKANIASASVSVISDSNDTVVATIPVGSNPFYLGYDSGKGEIFVGTGGTSTNMVYVISDANDSVVSTISMQSPTGFTYDSGKGEIFVSNWYAGTVSIISDSSAPTPCPPATPSPSPSPSPNPTARAKHVSANTLQPNSWVKLAPMNQARAWLEVASVNGKIYAIGGSTASGDEPETFPYGDINLDNFVGTNEGYDPASNSWSYEAPMPTPRMAFAIAAVQGKIYCIGGRSIAGDISGGYTSVNEVYDPTTNTWETKAPMPIANGWISATVIDNKIYIPDPSGGFFVYDPSSDTWNSSVPSPSDGTLLLEDIPGGYETTGIMSPKMVYTFNSNENYEVKAYNPENDNYWQYGDASYFEYFDSNYLTFDGFGVAVANDIFYVVGGYTYSVIGPFAPIATNEEYIPFGYGTPDPSYVLEHTKPQISLVSPLNQIYNDSSISITFTVNKNITSASYSLDGQQNVTITGNTTITGLPSGLHNVTVYANDTFGNIGVSQTINFSIAIPKTESFPTATVAAVSCAIVVVVIAVLLFYFRRRRRVKLNG